MPFTVINSDLTTTQFLDGADTTYVTQSASIITSTTANAVDITGSTNTVIVDGLLVSQRTTIEVDSASTSIAISVGETGRIIGLNSAYYAIHDKSDDSVITNHGQISAAFAIGLIGNNNVVNNTGLIESTYTSSSANVGVTMRGNEGVVNNSGSILGVNWGVGSAFSYNTNSIINNSGLIAGDIGVYFGIGLEFSVINSGVITGYSGLAIQASIDDANILNTGTLSGDVLFSAENGFIKNSGEIHGDVLLAEAGSFYKGAVDGWVSGGVYGDIGNDTIYGASGFDYIEASGGTDLIKGRAGNDRIFAEGGADTVRGNDGDDEIYGGSSTDLLYGGRGDDTIEGGSGADTIYGKDGDDQILGGSAADLIYGGDGDDTIDAGTGADTIAGGQGNDLMTGNTGDDVFIFGRNSGNDEITDFENNTDTLDLSAFGAISVADLNTAGVIIDNGTGSIIDLTQLGGDGVIYVEDMTVAQWTNADFIF